MEINTFVSHNLVQIILGWTITIVVLSLIFSFIRMVFGACSENKRHEITVDTNSNGGGYPSEGTQNVVYYQVKSSVD